MNSPEEPEAEDVGRGLIDDLGGGNHVADRLGHGGVHRPSRPAVMAAPRGKRRGICRRTPTRSEEGV